eukprot:82536-Amphidinium_carterae.1
MTGWPNDYDKAVGFVGAKLGCTVFGLFLAGEQGDFEDLLAVCRWSAGLAAGRRPRSKGESLHNLTPSAETGDTLTQRECQSFDFHESLPQLTCGPNVGFCRKALGTLDDRQHDSLPEAI